jgi:DNA replication protein DnaC
MEASSKPLSALLGAKEPDREASCPVHGVYASRHVMRSIWTKCPTCEAEAAAAQQAADQARAKADAEVRHRKMLDQACIPARFERCTFENFLATTDEQRHALTVSREYVEDFAEKAKAGETLIFSGKPGTGKSHLAGAMLRALMSNDVRYITCLDMIRAVRDTWRKDSDRSETQILNYLERLDLLVIDEVGMQYGTEGEQTILFDVLDRRYRELKPVVLLTNQDKDGFRGYVGDRTYDRLRETCRWVAFDWASHRPQARRETV